VSSLWVGVLATAFGGSLLLFRRPLTAWNASAADATKSEHIRQVTQPNDGAPGYIVRVGGLILLVGVVLALIGVTQA
jgi:hypothetical protein